MEEKRENNLEGHARAGCPAVCDRLDCAVHFECLHAPNASAIAQTKLVLLHELALDPSEAEVGAAALALLPAHWSPDDRAMARDAGNSAWCLACNRARAALKAARAKRAEEISNV